MENDKFKNKRRNLARHFEDIFERLLTGETLDLYEKDVSSLFELITTNLLAEIPQRKGMWYDGVVGLTARVRKSRQVEFTGEMWVGDNKAHGWKEDFKARVTDKRITKQGFEIALWIGGDKAEGDFSIAFGFSEKTPAW